jgi:predicted RNase H-like HicB family nuclease
MQYQVLIQSQSEHQFVASVVGVPNCSAEGTSREEAVTKAESALKKKLADGELVTIEVETLSPREKPDPWLQHSGVFADDPTFEDFLQEVEAYRQAVDNASEA